MSTENAARIFEVLSRVSPANHQRPSVAKDQAKCKNVAVRIVEKIVWGWEKRKVKRLFQSTSWLRSTRFVVIVIRFFANLMFYSPK